MAFKTARINENIEDKARDLIKAIAEAEGLDYMLLLLCVADEEGHTTVMCVPSDPSRKQSKVTDFLPLINAISTWFLTITGQIHPDT